mmetsp:Transcript_11648/g.26570  ORF Transcript_11648/g.26570 Transcript_11648/m.26570 type:complete len:106 (+) Transcript_11648:79-396(+)
MDLRVAVLLCLGGLAQAGRDNLNVTLYNCGRLGCNSPHEEAGWPLVEQILILMLVPIFAFSVVWVLGLATVKEGVKAFGGCMVVNACCMTFMFWHDVIDPHGYIR